jgi:hypothetical protein
VLQAGLEPGPASPGDVRRAQHPAESWGLPGSYSVRSAWHRRAMKCDQGLEPPEGYTNAGSRRGLVVLVQQSAEEIPATYVSGHRGAD